MSSRRRHTMYLRDWSSYVCSSDLPAHAPHATARRRGRHWTQNVHRVTRWPSDDSLLPTVPLHTEHGIAPLPVTIETSPETTRSSCPLTNFFAGLIRRGGGSDAVGDAGLGV